MSYAESGVDRDEAYRFVDRITERARRTRREEVLSEIGDYGGFFRAPTHMKEPVFVATTDGVGTKLILAEEMGGAAHRAVGQDVVAMCVNDLISCRAEPLIFLDYIATGKMDPKSLDALLEGIISACEESGCSLAGGETAQMPGFYPGSRYDVAGFSVGVLEKSHRLDASKVRPGDIVYGMISNGFHSNGFSLVRKVCAENKWTMDQLIEGEVLGEALLRPTRLYVKPVLKLFSEFEVKLAAHITGGGLIENLPRGFKESEVRIVIERKQVPTSALMKRFVEHAKLTEKEAFCTWNMGVGFAFVLPSKDGSLLENSSLMSDLKIFKIGQVEKAEAGEPSVALVG